MKWSELVANSNERTYLRVSILALSLVLGACDSQTSGSEESDGDMEVQPASAAAADVPSNPMKEAYFGETHLHTAYSLDAYIGGTRLTPDDAYRFAKGEEMMVSDRMHQISTPLDFAAVTDHAEYIGEMYTTMVEGAPGHDQDLLVELRGLTVFEEKEAWFVKYVVSSNRSSTPQHTPFYMGEGTTRTAWQITLEAAERHNDPGTFTTIPAFEWSGAPNGGNLHRNVFFRDMNVPDLPVSYIEVNREDGLWEWMAGLEKRGMKVFAVPHNSNASKKMMFSPNDAAGNPIDLEYAQMRAHFEPLIEMMQIKGNSEVHRNFWAADEFSDFENADSLADYGDREIQKENFVRYGLVMGLEYEREIGDNPYKYGIIGGTDNHNGAANVTESNWQVGSHGGADGSVQRRRTGEITNWIKAVDLSPGAITGVWATSNTRGAIWDSMYDKETFATSGPRIKVRFFGGFELPATSDEYDSIVSLGYAKGVPMGGDLENPGSEGKHPVFTVWAHRDPAGGNLDRIQIIKGWMDADGDMQETIHDVAWSDGRQKDADGNLPAVGNSVELATATYSNDIGSFELRGSWTDTDFDPALHALYYVRVIQIPTPRWTTYDAVRANLPLLENVPATVQERAWTSPIWYRP
jgi:hypothetical protein